MRHTPDEQAAIRVHIEAGEQALAHRQFRAARHCLAEAQRLGAGAAETRALQDAIRMAEGGQRQRARLGGWLGFALACAGYLLLAGRQPAEWGVAVWVLLAFLVVPLVAGLVIGRSQDIHQGAFARFRVGLCACGWAMAGYSGITLMALRSRIGSGDGVSALLVGLFVTAAYGLLAGVVGGAICALAAGRSANAETT